MIKQIATSCPRSSCKKIRTALPCWNLAELDSIFVSRNCDEKCKACITITGETETTYAHSSVHIIYAWWWSEFFEQYQSYNTGMAEKIYENLSKQSYRKTTLKYQIIERCLRSLDKRNRGWFTETTWFSVWPAVSKVIIKIKGSHTEYWLLFWLEMNGEHRKVQIWVKLSQSFILLAINLFLTLK